MASITPYKDGWRAQIKIGDARDSQTFRTQREAKAWAANRETEIRAQKGRDPGELHTVGEMFREYIEKVSDKKAGARSEALRLKAFEKDFPHLAALKLAEFKTPQLVEWRDARLKKVKPGSVVRDINLIRNVFYTARDEWHWLTHNPFTGFKIPQEGAPRYRRIDPWGEVRPICRALGYVSGRAPDEEPGSGAGVSGGAPLCDARRGNSPAREGELRPSEARRERCAQDAASDRETSLDPVHAADGTVACAAGRPRPIFHDRLGLARRAFSKDEKSAEDHGTAFP